MEANQIMQYLIGGAAAVTILSALFFLANNYIVNKIGFTISEKLTTFERNINTMLKNEYITRAEINVIRENAEATHERHELQITGIYKLINKKI